MAKVSSGSQISIIENREIGTYTLMVENGTSRKVLCQAADLSVPWTLEQIVEIAFKGGEIHTPAGCSWVQKIPGTWCETRNDYLMEAGLRPFLSKKLPKTLK